jgi:uncharacterized damage-inducible protein DinB
MTTDDYDQDLLARDLKDRLHRSLQVSRDALLAKVEGLGEYDARRPMTSTGTNLLGLVKHFASVQLGYLGDVFGRPSGQPLPWFADEAEPDADLWVPADERLEDVLALHRRSAAHADATIEALPLGAHGAVPWWTPQNRAVTLGGILVHVCAEAARHAGHADILRELIDGSAGNGPGDPNLTGRTPAQWAAHRERIEQAAREAQHRWSGGAGDPA